MQTSEQGPLSVWSQRVPNINKNQYVLDHIYKVQIKNLVKYPILRQGSRHDLDSLS